jgi:hypothetical protein
MNVDGFVDFKCIEWNAERIGQLPLSAPLRNKAVHATDLGIVCWNYQACTQLLIDPITSDGHGFVKIVSSASISEVETILSLGRESDWVQMPYVVSRKTSKMSDYNNLTPSTWQLTPLQPWHEGANSL